MDIDLLSQEKYIIGELARRSIIHFALLVKPSTKINWHHELLAMYLQLFVAGTIKKLIICMPPQHGKSEFCSRLLPSYMLGLHPTKRIISASYNADTATKFNRDVQRIMDSPEYRIAFPDVGLNQKKVSSDAQGAWLRNRDEFEVVTYGGYYKNSGIGGGITGRSADIAIIDDPIKGAAEASSPTIRQAVIDWYTQDLSSRLNNGSQELIIMTRWHERDLVGFILSNPNVAKDWIVLSLPAIKENDNNPDDPREIGEALWPSWQGLERLLTQRALGERAFKCLYQQTPKANEDVLVYPNFELIDKYEYDNLDRVEVVGVDFGFNDETAIIGTKITKDNRLLMHEYAYQKGLTPDKLVLKLRELGIKKQLLVCDSARPELIAHLRAHRFNAIACKKGAGSVFTGIQLVKQYKMCITKESANLQQEALEYEWVTDGGGFATETPTGPKEHGLDAGRYATVQQDIIRRRPQRATYLDTTIPQ